MWKIAAFVLASAWLAYISRASLSKPKSHGFHRYFAWETILGLFLLNVEVWFLDPFSWNQLLAWALLLGSFVPLYLGVRALRALGRPDRTRAGDDSLLAFEKTTQLVTCGIYRFIRHPLYSSLLLLTWGIFFKLPSPGGLALAALSTLFLSLTAKADEAECIRHFGPAYSEYMRGSRMFVPFLF